MAQEEKKKEDHNDKNERNNIVIEFKDLPKHFLRTAASEDEKKTKEYSQTDDFKVDGIEAKSNRNDKTDTKSNIIQGSFTVALVKGYGQLLSGAAAANSDVLWEITKGLIDVSTRAQTMEEAGAVLGATAVGLGVTTLVGAALDSGQLLLQGAENIRHFGKKQWNKAENEKIRKYNNKVKELNNKIDQIKEVYSKLEKQEKYLNNSVIL